MYFWILEYNRLKFKYNSRYQILAVKQFLSSFPEIILNDYLSYKYYELNNQGLRKLKLQSLVDDKKKKRLETLLDLINDKELIDRTEIKPGIYPSYSCVGTSGSSGTYGKPKGDCISNRFVMGKVPKKFDFYKSNYKSRK